MDREQALSAMIAALFEDGDTPLVRQGMPQQTWEMLSIAADAVAALARSEAGRPVLDREAVIALLDKMEVAPFSLRGNLSSFREALADVVMGLARSEAEVKAEALREAADLGYYNSSWLRERADELEGKP